MAIKITINYKGVPADYLRFNEQVSYDYAKNETHAFFDLYYSAESRQEEKETGVENILQTIPYKIDGIIALKEDIYTKVMEQIGGEEI